MAHTPEERPALINDIRVLPQQLRQEVAQLSEEQLDFRPAPSEWSIRQIVHHVADSHMNGFIRFKWLLTEDHPTVKTYEQEPWAELPDTTTPPLEWSLLLIEGLHARWIVLLESLSPEQWARPGTNPETGEFDVARLLDIYSWHGTNHINQIRNNLAAMNAKT